MPRIAIKFMICTAVALAMFCALVLCVGCKAKPKSPADTASAKQATEIGRTFGQIGGHQDNIDAAARRILEEARK